MKVDQSKLIHITDIPHIKDEHIAFISYIINGHATVRLDNLVCLPTDVPFMKRKAVALFRFSSVDQEHVLEFWVIGDEDHEPMSLVQREIHNGKLDEGSVGMTQFVMRPYHKECVMQAIKDLPITEL